MIDGAFLLSFGFCVGLPALFITGCLVYSVVTTVYNYKSSKQQQNKIVLSLNKHIECVDEYAAHNALAEFKSEAKEITDELKKLY